ncbi:hypothetical protein LY78DRAFT_133886 [Colletotrichum sublineola]|nr:hypothetical protein LY78DRAFT_133886 [Colletotrichum sublineola]
MAERGGGGGTGAGRARNPDYENSLAPFSLEKKDDTVTEGGSLQETHVLHTYTYTHDASLAHAQKRSDRGCGFGSVNQVYGGCSRVRWVFTDSRDRRVRDTMAVTVIVTDSE